MGREYTRWEFVLWCLELLSVVVVGSGMTLYDLYHTRRELKILQLSSHLDMQMSIISEDIHPMAKAPFSKRLGCISWHLKSMVLKRSYPSSFSRSGLSLGSKVPP